MPLNPERTKNRQNLDLDIVVKAVGGGLREGRCRVFPAARRRDDRLSVIDTDPMGIDRVNRVVYSPLILPGNYITRKDVTSSVLFGCYLNV